MICMGAGTNHWFHSDQVYRTFLALVMMCGCEGRNGGGWAHYVGQEKVRPLTGWQTVAFALDWMRPPRHQSGHAVLLPGDRPVALRADPARAPGLAAGPGAARRPPHRRRERARRAAGVAAVVSELRSPHAGAGRRGRARGDRAGRVRRAGAAGGAAAVRVRGPRRAAEPSEGDDGVALEPARLLGQGPRVLPQAPARRHRDSAVRAEESPPELRPREVVWREQAPEGKLDLLTTIDFRMTSNALFSDVVLPAATWYEKYDLSSTDLHPFVHAFNEAIAPPWEAKSDWEAFHRIAKRVLAPGRAPPRQSAGTWSRRRCCTTRRMRSPSRWGRCATGRPASASRCRAARCRSCWWSSATTRTSAERWAALGPLLEELGSQTKGAAWKPIEEVAELRAKNGAVRGGVADGRPSLGARRAGVRGDPRAVGHDATAGWRSRGSARWRRAPASQLADLARPRAGDRITFAGRAGAAADGDHLAGVVGDRGARPPLRAVHDQRRAREAVAHALGPPALLSRSRLDARARRGAAGVPPAASSPRDLRRPGRAGRLGPGGADAAST